MNLASQVTDWDVKLRPEELDVLLLSTGFDRVRSLKVESYKPRVEILETPNSPFLDILDKCTTLSSLTITQKARSANRDTPLIHPDILLRSFPFTHTLRSLTFEIWTQRCVIEPNHLQLAAIFPLLEHLKLPSDRTGSGFPDETRTILLPSLTHLEIQYSQAFEAIDKDGIPSFVYADLDLPLLARLDLTDSPEFSVDSHYKLCEQFNVVEEVVRDLLHYKSSLKIINVYTNGSPIINDVIADLSRVCSEVKVNWMPGLYESIVDLSENNCDWFDEDEEEEDTSGMREKRRKLYAGYDKSIDLDVSTSLMRLASWLTGHAISVTEDKDGRRARQVFQLLEPVSQLKKWMED